MYCNPNNFNLYYPLYDFFSSESISIPDSSKKSFSKMVIGCFFSALSKSAGSSFFPYLFEHCATAPYGYSGRFDSVF
jgi:hypothetical protein